MNGCDEQIVYIGLRSEGDVVVRTSTCGWWTGTIPVELVGIWYERRARYGARMCHRRGADLRG